MKTWNGTVHYVTGGTTHQPRLISYSAERWRCSIEITADVLRKCGVSAGSRVAVCQPFAPWAIGGVFTEAALLLGAHVYPFGLYVRHRGLLDLFEGIDPTDICGTARNLVRLKLTLDAGNRKVSDQRRTIFAAGEPLTAAVRQKCSTLWNANVINVYGMAEFDTVGAELPGSTGLVLVPLLDYALLVEGKVIPLASGVSGQLLIRDSHDGDWFHTGDRVRILHPRQSSEWNTWTVLFLQRDSECVCLSDGSTLTLDHLDYLLKTFESLDQVQVHVRHTLDGDELTILCVLSSGEAKLSAEAIRECLLASSIDLQDSYQHGVISKLSVEIVPSEALFATSRGKVPTFVESDTYDDLSREPDVSRTVYASGK